MLHGGGTNASFGLGSAPGGATLIRVHLPWSLGTVPPGGTAQPGNAPGMQTFPGAAGSTPTPPLTLPSAPGTPSGQAQLLTLNVSGPTALVQSIVLTAGSPGCVSAGASAICQAALSLQPGTYSAAVATYATPTAVPGNQIAGTQTIAFTVSYGASNVVNVALSGVVAQVGVVPGSSMSAENAQSGIDLYGTGKHQLVAQLLDANGNIVLGPAAPTVNAVQAGGTLALTIAPSASTPNAFNVTPPPAYNGGSATLRVTANFAGPGNPCVQPGANCSGNVTVDVRQLLAVANSSANTVTLYAGGQNVPLVTIQNGVTGPQALVFDPAGDLFVGQAGSVAEYSPPYTGSPVTIGAGANHPQALAVDVRGNLFVANGSASNTVTEYAPPYSGAPIATISNGIDDPVSLALDASGNVYVANQASNTVTLYAPPYNAAPTALSSGLNGPNSLAIDGRGNLFVSNLNSTPNAVVEFVPPFAASSAPVATISNGVNEQGAIGLSPSAALFVPNQGANTVTEYAPPYSGMPTVISGGQSQPIALAIDSSGNLFVANYGNNTVTMYSPPYVGGSWVTLSNGVNTPQALALSPPTAGMQP